MRDVFMIDENSFIDHLSLFNNKIWAEKYFDLIAEVINTTGLHTQDSRMVTSVVRGDAYFPVTVNNRYVLAASKYHDNFYVICQRAFYNREDLHLGVSYYFKQLPGEKANNDVPPIFVEVDSEQVLKQELIDDISNGWKR